MGCLVPSIPSEAELRSGCSTPNVLSRREDDRDCYVLVGLQTEKSVNQFVNQYTLGANGCGGSLNMTSDQLIRRTLWATAAFNVGGSMILAFPGSYLGQLNGLPADVPALYRFLLPLLIFAYGLAYAWLARQKSISRPFIAFVAANKSCVFAVAFILWLLHETSFLSVVALSGDLIFAVLFVLWLVGTQQSLPSDASKATRA